MHRTRRRGRGLPLHELARGIGRGQKVALAEGFVQAGEREAARLFARAIAGGKHARDAAIAEFARDVEPRARADQLHVEQREIGAARFGERQRAVVIVRDAEHDVAAFDQHVLDHGRDEKLVFHDDQLQWTVAHSASSRMISKRAPASAGLVRSSPRIWRTSPDTILIPIPDLTDTLKPAGSPGPSSDTVTAIRPSCMRFAVTVISQAASCAPCLIALVSSSPTMSASDVVRSTPTMMP